MYGKGDYIILKTQQPSHLTGKRHVKIGTVGYVLATRMDGDELQLLVKFDGHAGPRHTSAKNVDKH